MVKLDQATMSGHSCQRQGYKITILKIFIEFWLKGTFSFSFEKMK